MAHYYTTVCLGNNRNLNIRGYASSQSTHM